MTAAMGMSVAEPVARSPRRGLRKLLGVPGLVGAGMTVAIAATSAIGPLLLSSTGRERVARPFSPPGPGLPLGADDTGKDLFDQLIVGSRVSLGAAFLVAVFATLIAGILGGAAGIGPRWLSALLMRATDIVLALPMLAVLLLAAAFLGQGFGVRVTLLTLLLWANYARVVRAGVLTAWSRGHLESARAMGAPPRHLLVRHASYVVAPLLVPIFVRTAMIAVLLDASLSFLGLGDPTIPSWGSMLYWASVNGVFLTDAWQWWALPPGLAITLTVVSLALVGVAVEERINPALAGDR